MISATQASRFAKTAFGFADTLFPFDSLFAAWTDMDLGSVPGGALRDASLVAFVARSRLPLTGEYAMYELPRFTRCGVLPPCPFHACAGSHCDIFPRSVSLDVSGCQAITYACLVRSGRLAFWEQRSRLLV